MATGLLIDLRRLARSPEKLARLARASASTAYLGDRTAVCRVLGRLKIFVDVDDQLSAHLMLDGYWEMWVTLALIRAVRPGMTVVDVGANVGYFTLLLAYLCGSEGRVLSFAPNRAVADTLRRSVEQNGYAGFTRVAAIALGADEREAPLFVPRNASGGGSLYVEPPDAQAQSTQVCRLDSFSDALTADVIKIDAEGAEEEIWRGMSGILAQRRPLTIVMEFSSDRLARPERFLSDVLGEGFRMSLVDPKGVRRRTVDQVLKRAEKVPNQMLLLRR